MSNPMEENEESYSTRMFMRLNDKIDTLNKIVIKQSERIDLCNERIGITEEFLKKFLDR